MLTGAISKTLRSFFIFFFVYRGDTERRWKIRMLYNSEGFGGLKVCMHQDLPGKTRLFGSRILGLEVGLKAGTWE
jgi:hypothetical protein